MKNLQKKNDEIVKICKQIYEIEKKTQNLTLFSDTRQSQLECDMFTGNFEAPPLLNLLLC